MFVELKNEPYKRKNDLYIWTRRMRGAYFKSVREVEGYLVHYEEEYWSLISNFLDDCRRENRSNMSLVIIMIMVTEGSGI